MMTPALLDEILESTLPGLVDELSSSNWYVRERDVINLFVFGHLVPAFLSRGLDLTLMGIEVPVLQVERHAKSRLGAYKDLVIWREPRSSRWKGCEVSLPLDWALHREHGCKPLAILEWKNLSRILVDPGSTRSGHINDIEWLKDNVRAKMCEVGYATLVDQTRAPTLTCRRIDAQGERDFLSLPKATVATAGA